MPESRSDRAADRPGRVRPSATEPAPPGSSTLPDPELASSAPPPPTSDHPLTGSITPIRGLIALGVVAAVILGMYLLVPKVVGLHQTWGRLRRGDPLWLVAGAALELLSIGGYAVLFRTVFGRGVPRIDWRASVEIPLAGIAAIRLVAAAGAGGVAVTVWALRRAGLAAEVIACRMVASLVIQYSVYLGALVVGGVGLWAGVFPGGGSVVITLVPAGIAAAMGVTIVSLALMPRDIEDRVRRFTSRPGAIGWITQRAVKAPDALGSGVRTAGDLVRHRPLSLLGALAYWGFDIAVLGVCFHAFGTVVALAVLVMGYFLGTLGNLLPLPGGIGGVEGGMIGAFVAFGVPARSTVVAVLAYRAISFWLPTLPGIAGYLSLRSRVRHWRLLDQSAPEAPEG